MKWLLLIIGVIMLSSLATAQGIGADKTYLWDTNNEKGVAKLEDNNKSLKFSVDNKNLINITSSEKKVFFKDEAWGYNLTGNATQICKDGCFRQGDRICNNNPVERKYEGVYIISSYACIYWKPQIINYSVTETIGKKKRTNIGVTNNLTITKQGDDFLIKWADDYDPEIEITDFLASKSMPYHTNIIDSGAVTKQVASENLLVYYPFDYNLASDTLDYAYKSGWDDANFGTASWQNSGCVRGSCFDLNDDYISMSEGLITELGAELTITGWFKIKDYANAYDLISADLLDGNDRLTITADGQWDGDLGVMNVFDDINNRNEDLTSDLNGVYELNTWYFFAFTCGSHGKELWIDDTKEVDDGDTDCFDELSADDFRIGEDGEMQGFMDEIMLFDRVLTDAEISKLYNFQYETFHGSYLRVILNETKGDNTLNVTTTSSQPNQTNITGQAIAIDGYETDLSKVHYPVAWYHLDNDTAYGEHEDLVVDFAGNRNLTVTSGHIFESNFLYGAIDTSGGNFGISDGSDNYALWNQNRNITVSAWFLMNGLGTNRGGLVSYGRRGSSPDTQWVWGIDQTQGSLDWVNANGAASVSLDIDAAQFLGRWSHIICTVNASGGMWCMVNGVRHNETAQTYYNSSTAPQKRFFIGNSRQWSSDTNWEGLIDEVMFWNQSLNESQMFDVFNLTGMNVLETTASQNIEVGTDKKNQFNFTTNESSLMIMQYNFIGTNATPTVNETTLLSWNRGEEAPPAADPYPNFQNILDNNATLTDSGVVNINATIGNATSAWVEFNATSNFTMDNSGEFYNATFQWNENGTFQYFIGALNGTLQNTTTTYYYTINTTPPAPDNEHPQFSNYVDNPDAWSFSQAYSINATVTHTNGTVIFQYDNINYSGSSGGGKYFINLNNLPAGTYDWIVSSYGNGTDENYNSSEVQSHTIAKSIPSLSLTCTSPITYGTTTDCNGAETNDGDSDMSYSIDNPNAVYEAGTKDFNYSTSGGQNYTAGSDFETVTINQATPSLSLSGTTPITYPTTTDFSGSGCPAQLTCSLNISNDVYDVGVVNANYSTSGNNNYTSASDTYAITIQQNTTNAITPLLNGNAQNLTVTWPQQTNASYSGNNATQVIIERDGTPTTIAANESLAAGNYQIEYNLTGTINYAQKMYYRNITILKASQTANLNINETSPIVYGTNINVTCNGELFRNDTNVTSEIGTTVLLNVGTYAYSCKLYENQNQTYDDDNSTLIVNAVVDNDYPQFTNIKDNNATIFDYGIGIFNVTVTSTNNTVQLSFNSINYTADQSGNLFNVSLNLTNGTYPYYWSAYGNGTLENYNQTNTYYFTVNETIAPDTQAPQFTQYPTNTTLTFGNSYITKINATDDYGISNFFVNNTKFTINPSGTLQNSTGLAVGLYYLNLSVNDTSNNFNQTFFWINVTQASGDVRAYLNGVRSNATANNNTQNYNFSVQKVFGEGLITMKINGTNYNSGSNEWISNLSDLQNWGINKINITGTLAESQNYTGDEETWWLTITEPVILPSFQGNITIIGINKIINRILEILT